MAKIDWDAAVGALEENVRQILESRVGKVLDSSSEAAEELARLSSAIVRYWRESQTGDLQAEKNLRHARVQVEAIVAIEELEAQREAQHMIGEVIDTVLQTGLSLFRAAVVA